MHHATHKPESHADVFHMKASNFNVKFFKNPLFCSSLQEYLWREYTVQCRISYEVEVDDEIGIPIELSGAKIAVKHARDHIKALFEMVQTKVYNNEITDKKVIYWSKKIYSDSAIDVIQKIFDNKGVFTVWEKTNILSGYYVIHYFSPSYTFHVSEKCIDSTINNEIAYAQDKVIHNFNSIQTNFRKELNQFINDKKKQQQQLQTLAIIYCEYPLQTELKISFFGQKSMREYLLDNYVHQLKNIELEYKDDNVKIQIRENLFHAPQYLSSKIKQLINALVFQTATISFQCLENACTMTVNEHLKIEQIARKYNCQIDKINVQTNNELVKLPKTRITSTIKSTSTFIIDESNRFIASVQMLNRLSISTGGIEILKTKDLIIPPVNITIISTMTDAVKEQIEPDCGNFYSETDSGRKVLFIPWTPPSIKLDSDETEIILEESIKEFVSICLTQIVTLCSTDMKIIAVSTAEWENYSNKKQLAEKIIHALKFQLETKEFSNRDWTILFIFDEKQSEMYDLFTQTILSLRAETNDYEQFYYPISTITIHLKTSRNYNIIKCQNAINDYLRKHMITTVELDDAFDSEIWNQHMINVYYKYCIEKFVFPRIYLINEQSTRQQLDLIGSASAVNEMKQRHEFMSEIIKQKILVPMQTDKQIETMNFHQSPQLTLDDVLNAYNILILSCPEDEILSNRLATRLIAEGYLVHTNYSNQLSLNARLYFEKTDLILVYFSRNYSKNEQCLALIKQAQVSEKKIISILSTQNQIEQDKNWLDSVTTTDLYYELFREESRFKLDEDFDLEYDKLLIELLHHTKPGIVGRMYSIQPIDENQEKQPEDASYQQDLQQQMTLNQRCQREEIYEKDIEKIKDRDKIPTDEVVKLIECLTLVIEDCRSDNLLGVEDKQEIEEKPYGAIVFEENNRDIGPDVVHEDREAHQYQYGQEVIRTDEHQTRGYSSNSYRRRKEIYASGKFFENEKIQEDFD
ncbi:unnamed protein product [Rotaria sp. Silwood1]|nr:unnamed protein product [Rotaria sp. Silwood1]